MRALCRFLCSSCFLLLGLAAPAQDLSTFLSQPPGTGAWASYRVETSWPGRTKTERLNLAVTGEEKADGKDWIWLEAWPMDFVKYSDGVMKLQILADPTPAEAQNPFLQARALLYQEPKEAPFRLSDGALGIMHGQAKKIRVDQKRTDLPAEDATATKGVTYHCTVQKIETVTESSLFGRDIKVTESGTFWFSKMAPFLLVKAQFERLQVQKGKEDRHRTVTITLRECGFTGAEPQIKGPVTKEKGLLGLLLH
jgi:predicted peroxiredoxin